MFGQAELRDVHAVFARLLGLSDAEVLSILAVLAAESLPCGSTLVEAVGNQLEIDPAENWSAEETLFDLLRDKQVINAIIKQVGGTASAKAVATLPAKLPALNACLNAAMASLSLGGPRGPCRAIATAYALCC